MPLTVGEGMTGSRSPACPPAPNPEPGHAAARQPHPTHSRRSDADTDPDRLTEHASPDAGGKATPLRGRPFGRALTPTPATTRPTPDGHGKKKGQPARPHGLTGPTPSGMTCGKVTRECSRPGVDRSPS